jgi:hypothetical protein
MRTYLGAALGLAFLGPALVIGACSKSYDATPTGVKCTPGNYVFCRCEDRSEGTKLCLPDGISFEACKCDGTGGPLTPDPDAGLGNDPLVGVDAGPTTGPTIDAKCAGKLGLVAGSSADLDAYVAAYTDTGSFAVSKSHGPALRGPATILPVGGTLVATWLSQYSLIAWSKLSAGAWSSPVSVGSAMSASATSATLLNGQVRLFYLGLDSSFHMGTYASATGWDDATALAEPAGDAGTPVPGKSAPATAAVGSSITLAFTGNDGTLARENFASGSWSSVTKFTGSDAYAAAPAIVALDPGGTRDELMVYTGKDLLLHVAARVATNKAWNAAILFDTAASSTELALQALPGGKALLVYKASNNQGYYAVWDAATGFGAPAELLPGKNQELASVPSITRGQCGSDATIAYAQKDGLVKILRFTGGALTGPYDVGGLTKATYVGVGELP